MKTGDHHWPEGTDASVRARFDRWLQTERYPATVVLAWQALIAAAFRDAADPCRWQSARPMTHYLHVVESMPPHVAACFKEWWGGIERVSFEDYERLLVQAWLRGSQYYASLPARDRFAEQRAYRLGDQDDRDVRGSVFDEVVVGHWLHIELLNHARDGSAEEDPLDHDNYFAVFGSLALWFSVAASGDVTVHEVEDRAGEGHYPNLLAAEHIAQSLADAAVDAPPEDHALPGGPPELRGQTEGDPRHYKVNNVWRDGPFVRIDATGESHEPRDVELGFVPSDVVGYQSWVASTGGDSDSHYDAWGAALSRGMVQLRFRNDSFMYLGFDSRRRYQKFWTCFDSIETIAKGGGLGSLG